MLRLEFIECLVGHYMGIGMGFTSHVEVYAVVYKIHKERASSGRQNTYPRRRPWLRYTWGMIVKEKIL